MNDVSYGQAIEGQFQIRRNLTAGYTTLFTMLFAASGVHAETPLRIVYRPRWWVELEVRPRASRNVFAFAWARNTDATSDSQHRFAPAIS